MWWIIFGIMMMMIQSSQEWYIENHHLYREGNSSAPYYVHCINWYGMEIASRTVEGLWIKNIHEHIVHMKKNHFNTIRIPFALEGILCHNYDLPLPVGMVQACEPCRQENATSYQILDMILDTAFQNDMVVILDLHRLSFSKPSPQWFSSTFPIEDTLRGVSGKSILYGVLFLGVESEF